MERVLIALTAAGGYREWLSVVFQIWLKTPPSGSVCQSTITATGPVAVLLAAARARRRDTHNSLGLKKLTGLSAAYGEGLLLRGLPVGAHTVRATGSQP